jgi:hypothetical protein
MWFYVETRHNHIIDPAVLLQSLDPALQKVESFVLLGVLDPQRLHFRNQLPDHFLLFTHNRHLLCQKVKRLFNFINVLLVLLGSNVTNVLKYVCKSLQKNNSSPSILRVRVSPVTSQTRPMFSDVSWSSSSVSSWMSFPVASVVG